MMMKQVLPAMFLLAVATTWCQTLPAPPRPVTPPAATEPLVRYEEELQRVREHMELAREEMERHRVRLDAPIRAELDAVRGRLDAMGLAAQTLPSLEGQVREDLERVQEQMQRAREEMARSVNVAVFPDKLFAQQVDAMRAAEMALLQQRPRTVAGTYARRDDEERLYRDGKRSIEEKDYEDALEEFNRVIEKKGARADAALYWRAYTLNKMGRRNEALETLAEIERSYPKSRWLDDAKALGIEVKQSSGQPVSPDAETNEDLKVLAVQGLIHSDPERGIPVLEKILTTAGSPRLKERALFVLAQTNNERGRQLLIQLARGATNPDLQLRAIEYLGYQKEPEIVKNALAGLYTGTSDVNIKRSVLRAYMALRDKDRLLEAARSESASDLRREAIRALGSLGAEAELWQLYDAESTADVRIEILRAMPHFKEGSDRLVEIAKNEKDPDVRRELIRQLGYSRSEKHADALVALYRTESDSKERRVIVESLRRQQNAKALVELARAESDPKMKVMLTEALTRMKSKEATDYLLELLSK